MAAVAEQQRHRAVNPDEAGAAPAGRPRTETTMSGELANTAYLATVDLQRRVARLEMALAAVAVAVDEVLKMHQTGEDLAVRRLETLRESLVIDEP